jgi:hypothetical protein
MTPNTIQFSSTDSTWVMRITADRRIEVNEDVEVTEAAQKVLDAMQHLLNPAPVQEPVAWMYPDDYERMLTSETFCTVYSVEVGSATRGESSVALYTTPPAPAVPDALTSADIQEHIEYVAGWNDCRQAMMEMMK